MAFWCLCVHTCVVSPTGVVGRVLVNAPGCLGYIFNRAYIRILNDVALNGVHIYDTGSGRFQYSQRYSFSLNLVYDWPPVQS